MSLSRGIFQAHRNRGCLVANILELRTMFRFTIRDLWWLTALAAVRALGWVDRQSLIHNYDVELRREKIHREMGDRIMRDLNLELGKKLTAQRLELRQLKDQKAASEIGALK